MQYITTLDNKYYIATSYLLVIPMLRVFMNKTFNKTLRKMYNGNGFIYNCVITSEELKENDIGDYINFNIKVKKSDLNDDIHKKIVKNTSDLILSMWKTKRQYSPFPDVDFTLLEEHIIDKFYEYIMNDDKIVEFLTYSGIYDLPIIKIKLLNYQYIKGDPIIKEDNHMRDKQSVLKAIEVLKTEKSKFITSKELVVNFDKKIKELEDILEDMK